VSALGASQPPHPASSGRLFSSQSVQLLPTMVGKTVKNGQIVTLAVTKEYFGSTNLTIFR
jgi:hypothetical protein